MPELPTRCDCGHTVENPFDYHTEWVGNKVLSLCPECAQKPRVAEPAIGTNSNGVENAVSVDKGEGQAFPYIVDKENQEDEPFKEFGSMAELIDDLHDSTFTGQNGRVAEAGLWHTPAKGVGQCPVGSNPTPPAIINAESSKGRTTGFETLTRLADEGLIEYKGQNGLPQGMTSVVKLDPSLVSKSGTGGDSLPSFEDTAEGNILHIHQLIQNIAKNFLELGKLLKINQENGYWQKGGFDTFQDFIESLGMKHSQAYQLMGIESFRSNGLLTEPQILEIGTSKMGLLVRAANKGKELTPEIISIAEQGTVEGLKRELGYFIPEKDGEKQVYCRCGEVVVCGKCGAKITKAVWKGKGK